MPKTKQKPVLTVGQQLKLLTDWIIKNIPTRDEIKLLMTESEERLSHQIGSFKSEIIDEYKRVDDNQIGLQGRVFDHENRIEKLEKTTHTVVPQ